MATKSIITGLVLIVLGVVVTVASDSSSYFVNSTFVRWSLYFWVTAGHLDLNHHFMHGAAMFPC